MPRLVKVRVALCIVALMVATGITRPGRAQQPQRPQSGDVVPPLIEAVWQQDDERFRQLLADGADPYATTNVSIIGRDRPAWAWAISVRDDRAATLLLSSVKAVDRAEGLLLAAHRNNASLTRTLLDKGMPVDARAIDGATALLVAAAGGHVDTARLLVERGADVNLADFQRDTPLMAAVRAGSIESVRLLLAGGADVNATDRAGRTALTWAARSRRTEVIDALRATGAKGPTAEAPTTLPDPRPAAARSLSLIQQGIAAWDERQSCIPCHHHPLMLRTTAVARRQGFAIDAKLLDAHTARMQKSFAGRANLVRQVLTNDAGVLRWTLRTGGDNSFGSGQFLSSFAEAGLEWPSLANEALLLGRLQLQDGRWRYAPERVPIMSSDFTATAAAIKSLQSFGSPNDAAERTARIVRAISWLESNVPATTEDKVFRLFGLRWSQSDEALLVCGDGAAERTEPRWRLVAVARAQQRRVRHWPSTGRAA